MADNFTASPAQPGGLTFASDDIGGIQYPRSKVGFGADGAYSDVSAANPFPVELTDGTNPVVIKPLSTVPVATDAALMTQAIIHGRTTAGGGSFVDVKVNPSGAISADISGSTNVSVTEPPLVLTGQAAQTAIVNNILTDPAGTDGVAVSAYRAASVQVVSTGTAGTYIFEQSNDGVNWIAMPVFNSALVTGVPITTAITATASAIIYSFPLRANFVRLRIVSTITGGAVQAFSRFSTESWTAAAQLVTSNTAANMLVTASGTVTVGSITTNTPTLAAGTNLAADVGFQYRANATGAATTFKFASAATVNNALILTGARRLLGWSLTNTTAAFRYFRFYNLATAPASGASPTFMVGIPPNSTVVSPPIVGGIAMSLGLGIACTAGVADTDATVTAANDVVGSIHYA